MHIHTLRLVPLTTRVECEGCDIRLRLATYDEAVMIQDEDLRDDGPLHFRTGIIVVPVDFSLYQEA